MADITVLIVCSDDLLISNAIQSASDNRSEVLVVLNGATDEVRSIAGSMATRVLEIQERGLGRARQVGIESVETRFVVFLDSDCVLRPNSLEKIRVMLEKYEVVRVGLTYRANTRGERLVAKLRETTTCNTEVPLLPIALDLTAVQGKIGTLFDARLTWGEDWPMGAAMLRSGLRIGRMAEPCVIHRAVGVVDDLRSAWRLGQGRRLRVSYGIDEPRSLLGDLLGRGEYTRFRRSVQSHGVSVALYHIIGWRLAYKLGYHTRRRRQATSIGS